MKADADPSTALGMTDSGARQKNDGTGETSAVRKAEGEALDALR